MKVAIVEMNVKARDTFLCREYWKNVNIEPKGTVVSKQNDHRSRK